MSSLNKKITFLLRKPHMIILGPILKAIPYFGFLYKKDDYQTKVSFGFWFKQKILNIGGNNNAYWPVHWTSKVYDAERIVVGIDSAPGIMGGAYITGIGGITIGDHCLFAKNIVIVTANHSIYDFRQRKGEAVNIGNYCWLGAGAKVMPGVTVGDHTVVAAGAVVTKSFPEGHCVLAGVPAKKVKDLDKELCVKYDVKHRYNGYVKAEKFAAFREKKLTV